MTRADAPTPPFPPAQEGTEMNDGEKQPRMWRETYRRISTSKTFGPGHFVGLEGEFLLPFCLGHRVDKVTANVGSDVADSGRLKSCNRPPWPPTFRKHSRSEVRPTTRLSPDFSNKLAALQLVNEQRSLYGLRYHDHERYRCACMIAPVR